MTTAATTNTATSTVWSTEDDPEFAYRAVTYLMRNGFTETEATTAICAELGIEAGQLEVRPLAVA